MTSRKLRSVLAVSIGVYAAAVLAAIFLRIHAPAAYPIYKDSLPLLIAIPAAYLAFSFQRRSAYMQALRSLWGNTIAAVAAARTYTDTPEPSADQYSKTLERLSTVVDECRGVFKNIPVPGDSKGWFPFEPIRQIFWEIRDLGHGAEATPEKRQYARVRLEEMWEGTRNQMLAEFDRDTPTHHHAEYVLPISRGHQAHRRTRVFLVVGADQVEPSTGSAPFV